MLRDFTTRFVGQSIRRSVSPSARAPARDLGSRVTGLFSRVHATLQPALSICRSVRRSVGPSVTLSFFRHLRVIWGLLLLPNRLGGQFPHCPCPPARDFGSCIQPCLPVMATVTVRKKVVSIGHLSPSSVTEIFLDQIKSNCMY